MNFRKISWAEARDGLKDTFNGLEAETAAWVESGKVEAWSCELGIFLTECLDSQSEVFIWCFQGRGALQLWHVLARLVAKQGYTRMGCFTRHKAATWLFRKYHPHVTCKDGEYRICIEIAELLKYDCSGTICSSLDQKSIEPSRRRSAECDSWQHAIQFQQ